jgi:hypothetical protein
MDLTRREFLLSSGALLGSPGLLQAASAGIETIEPLGTFLTDCSLAGERRADDVVPAHPNGLQISRDRWLLVYGTRGFRGVDDDRSSVYQLRKGGPDGPLIKEGFLRQTQDDWDPYKQGKPFSRQGGHAVAFGVPKGAKIGGKPAPSANVFVAKWYVHARHLDKAKNFLEHGTADIRFGGPQLFVEGLQFRLNDREDDIEILRPAEPLRQKGYEKGERFSSAEPVAWMNQPFVPAVPFNRDATEWADCMGFDGGRVAPARYVWNPKTGLYEWTETGPFLGDANLGLFESSLARHRDGWVISTRMSKGGTAWVRCDDPFSRLPAPVLPKEPQTSAPLTAFACPDGGLRAFSGDKGRRDPLFMWDVNPEDGFACTNARVIFDSVKAGLKIRPASQPKVDMCKLLPAQGRTQFALFRVSVRSFNHPYAGRPGIPIVSDEEKAACAIYAARLTYAEPAAPIWEF